MQKQGSQSVSTASHRDPSWWSDTHTSAWDRVKEAFQRDWEQTKADFSSTSGQELNQDVGDTLKQAVGAAPLPPPGVKTPEDPKDIAKDAYKARKDMIDAQQDVDTTAAKAKATIAKDEAKLSEKVADARIDAAKMQAKTSEKIADARIDAAKMQAKAGEKIAEAQQDVAEDARKQQEKVAEAAAKRDEAAAKWRQAEQEARYGYAVRMQRPTDEWNDTLEGSLRDEWNALGTGKTWDESRHGIRRGWDHASRKH